MIVIVLGSGVAGFGTTRSPGSEGSLVLAPLSGSTGSSSCSTPLHSTNPIRVDQAEIPDSLDPAVSFSTAGWGAIQQVYQGLVNYNGTSDTSFSGVLAENWSASSSGPFESVIFHLRPDVHFSNGDPYNAYVQWFSLYRSLLLEQGTQFILEQNFFSTNFSVTQPLSYYSPIAAITAANTTLVNDLNSWNFFDPTAAEIALMSTANQSFQVINNLAIALNLGFGYLASNYTYLLASIADPNSYAVDPSVVQTHGGVVEGLQNSYLAVNTVGTGQYVLTDYNGIFGGGYTLTPDSNYWGKAAASRETWNPMIQPANTSVDVVFQGSVSTIVQDLESGGAASASIAYLTYLSPSTILQLQANPCVVTQALPTVFGATQGSWWVYLDLHEYPFNNLSVREAIAHAINYSEIYQAAFGGYATSWVGPVPPAYPYYNPQNLAPYGFNLTLARQEIANSPCANDACGATNFSFEYVDAGPAWLETAELLAADLSVIGLTIKPVPVTLTQFYFGQGYTLPPGPPSGCMSHQAVNGGPFYIGLSFYSSDYFSPDDWTQNDAATPGSANQCAAGFSNSTVDSDVFAAAADSNSTALTNLYSQMTQILYDNYSEIWLVVPTLFAVSSEDLHGVLQNPMGSVEPAAMLFNTQWAYSPVVPPSEYPVDFIESGLPANESWSVTLNTTTNSSATSQVDFVEPNGTFSFTVGSVAEYTVNPSAGSIRVNGSAVSQSIAFKSSSSVTFLGLPAAEGYALLGGIVAVVVVGAVVAVLLRGRRRAPPAVVTAPSQSGPGSPPTSP